jgi:hypothetical protein
MFLLLLLSLLPFPLPLWVWGSTHYSYLCCTSYIIIYIQMLLLINIPNTLICVPGPHGSLSGQC